MPRQQVTFLRQNNLLLGATCNTQHFQMLPEGIFPKQ
jgi:hypothetical protein